MTQAEQHSFTTRAVHAGERQTEEGLRPVVGPIHPSVGYTFADSHDLDQVLGGEQPGYVYSARYENPTTRAFERAIAELEGAEDAYAFASGMAAIHAALLAAGLKAGETVVAAADVYGATYTLLKDVLGGLGVRVQFVDVLDVGEVATAVAAHAPRVLFVETLSNPLLKVADLPALAEIAASHDVLLLVDNTFATPYLCQPLAMGADMVIHSATKYIGGHGDVMAGIVATSAELRTALLTTNKLIGASLGPFEAWLAHRGLKTLALRLKQQCATALEIASWLQQHSRVAHVNYAFLPDHPQFGLMQQLSQGRGAGAVLSFEIAGAGREEVFAFMDRLQLIQPATTLGDIYSLALYPAISSHRTLTPEERQALGIGEGLMRLSIGIEDVRDIRADLAQALGE